VRPIAPNPVFPFTPRSCTDKRARKQAHCHYLAPGDPSSPHTSDFTRVRQNLDPCKLDTSTPLRHVIGTVVPNMDSVACAWRVHFTAWFEHKSHALQRHVCICTCCRATQAWPSKLCHFATQATAYIVRARVGAPPERTPLHFFFLLQEIHARFRCPKH